MGEFGDSWLRRRDLRERVQAVNLHRGTCSFQPKGNNQPTRVLLIRENHASVSIAQHELNLEYASIVKPRKKSNKTQPDSHQTNSFEQTVRLTKSYDKQKRDRECRGIISISEKGKTGKYKFQKRDGIHCIKY